MKALEILFNDGFAWRLQYVLRMRSRADVSWEYCWESAQIAYADWRDEGPVEICDEDLECWSD
jgi:hypothetical protein